MGSMNGAFTTMASSVEPRWCTNTCSPRRCAPARQHAERDGRLEFRTPVARGHVAFGLGRRRRGGDLRADREPRAAIGGRQRHQLKALRVARRRAAAANGGPTKFACLALDAARKTDILRQRGTVGIGADVDVALFGAHDLERLDAVGHGGKIAARAPTAARAGLDVVGRQVDLIAQLAAETRAQHAQGHPIRACSRAGSCAASTPGASADRSPTARASPRRGARPR